MQLLLTTILIAVSCVATLSQGPPRAALAQGARVFELSALNVVAGADATSRVLSWSVAAKPEGPKEHVHLVLVIRESGGTPFGLLRLDAANFADCVSRSAAGQVAGWGAFDACRVKKPPVLIGWRLRVPVPNAQLVAGKMQIAVDNLPPEGWLEVGLSIGAVDPTKDPTDRIVSNSLSVKLEPAK